MSEDEEAEVIPKLMAMAELKWDSYEGFRAGQRFMESLARWLRGFENAETRQRWITFLLEQLIFVSAAEVDHLIAVTYPDMIRPAVLGRIAADQGIPAHKKSKILETANFKSEQRRILVLALSDGARLDLLRRNSDLSHEQFVPTLDVPDDRRAELSSKLEAALRVHGAAGVPPSFNHVLLVDDFYGSGTSLIDISKTTDGEVAKGKMKRFLDQAEEWVLAPDGETPFLAGDYSGTILLYMASAAAEDHIKATLAKLGLASRWRVSVVQRFESDCRVTDADLLDDCDAFWDPVLEDEHKKCAARGYKDSALPLVLYHNSPNNSVSPLWADSTGRRRDDDDGLNRRALFPRYERHHSDRP